LEYVHLAEKFAVSGQISADEVAHFATAGFCTIVCNRPDGEQPGQPAAEEIAAACAEVNLAFSHIPMHGASIPAGGIETLRDLLAEANGLVLAYCASGQRSAYLWQVASS
jgi:uncharacterized protein (TIGR01244 family)